MAKNRIVPVRKMTLPQLELMAAVIGARLATHLRKALNICDITLWSDSQIVLNWWSTSKPFNRFVKNRVQEIHLLTEDFPWKYCPTDDNPADLLTRGITASQFTNNTLWNNGTSWITRKDEWPVWKRQPRDPMPLEEDNEHQSAMTFIHLSCQSQEGMERVINIEKYSK